MENFIFWLDEFLQMRREFSRQSVNMYDESD